MSMMLQMTVINAPTDDTVRKNTILLLVSLVTQVNTCQVMSPAIYASETNCKICQQSRYTNQNGQGSCKWCSAGKYISDHMTTQNEHDSSMTVINAPMDITVRKNIILLLVSLVTQVNTCQVMSPAIMRANQIVKYANVVDIRMQMRQSRKLRENTYLII